MNNREDFERATLLNRPTDACPVCMHALGPLDHRLVCSPNMVMFHRACTRKAGRLARFASWVRR